MSFGFCGFCSITEDKNNTLSLINKSTKIPIGKDRIYKLHRNEVLNNYTKSFYRSESLDFSLRKNSQKKFNIENSIFEMKMPYVCLFCGGKVFGVGPSHMRAVYNYKAHGTCIPNNDYCCICHKNKGTIKCNNQCYYCSKKLVFIEEKCYYCRERLYKWN